MELPKRKPNRLPCFNYNTPGAYFITICTKDRQCILWRTVGASIARPPLSHCGRIVEEAICAIPSHYPAVSIDHYVVMPNHVHLLLQIHTDENGHAMPSPTISHIIQQTKGIVTKRLGYSPWQKLFHDHVIRNEWDYLKIWEYIDYNPLRWKEDCFYIE